MKRFVLIILSLGSITAASQHTSNYADITFSGAKYQGAFAISYVHRWHFGENQKLGIGIGGRFTSYLAANQYYVTAPAKLTSGSTSPLIIFQDNITANIDTFLIKSPQVNSLNLSINIDYQLSKKFSAGFNIDAIGFSFGGSRNGNYINGSTGKMASATPTLFNILLVSDNDRGTLNSEFFVKYSLNDQWSLKLGAQFLFTEYTTSTKVQQFPEANDRFRNKSLLWCAGVSLKIK
jgi:long-subunit fatty acid transport protein